MQNAVGLLALVFMGVAWLIPNHYAPWNSFYNESSVAVALALFVFTAAAKRRAPEMGAVAWVLVAVAAIPWLQWAFGLLWFSGDAWIASLYVLGLALAISTGHSWAKLEVRRLAASLSSVALAASVMSCLIGFTQVLQLDVGGIWAGDGVAGMRADANLAQPNNLATLIGFGVVGLMLLREQGTLSAGSAGLLLAVQVVGLALTQSRSALLFGPLVACGLGWAAHRRIELKTRAPTVLAATALHWGMTWGWPAVQTLLLQSPPLSLADRGLGSIRFRVWPVLVDALSTAPWQGFGWLQVGAAELAAANRHPVAGELWLHAHNLFLDLLIWSGYPLGLLLCLLLVRWFASRVARISSVESLVGMLLVAVLALHSLLELPHHYAYFLIPVGMWVGLIEFQRGAQRLASAKWGVALATLCGLMTAAIWVDYPDLEEDFRRVRFERLNIGRGAPSGSASSSPALSSLTSFLRVARIEPRSGMTSTELDEMEAAVKRYPYVASLIRHASALALNGRLPEGTQRFVAIRHIHGDEAYRKAKDELRDKIARGQSELESLERSLPP
jgi:hypothetical protein